MRLVENFYDLPDTAMFVEGALVTTRSDSDLITIHKNGSTRVVRKSSIDRVAKATQTRHPKTGRYVGSLFQAADPRPKIAGLSLFAGEQGATPQVPGDDSIGTG